VDGENYFETIYELKLFNINLKELMLLQSIYMCKHLQDIVNLIEMQSDPQIFINPFLELGRKNMLHILAFDTRAISGILN